MELKLEIIDEYTKEDVKGSLPWLLRNASAVRIGLTSVNNQFASLLTHAGEVIICLIMRNGNFHDENGRVNGPLRFATATTNRESIFWTKFTFSPGAWKIIKKIQGLAAKEMKKLTRETDTVSVILVATKDKIVNNLSQDVTALPILHDRLKELF